MKVSTGCQNCYAEKMANRLAAIGIDGYKHVIKDGGSWSGNAYFNDVTILKPLSWKKPRRIFVCSMGDLFMSSVDLRWVDRVMAIAALCPEHTFIVLTKRANTMRGYLSMPKEELIHRWEKAVYDMSLSDKNDDIDAPACYLHNRLEREWPMKNLWIGVSVENQQQAYNRVPVLLSTPAAKRFVSAEPLLGKLDLINIYESIKGDARQLGYIDWVICGGESGHQARPVHPDWVRFLQLQCQTAEVPFFFKQWGEWLPSYDFGERLHELIERFPKCRIGNDHVFDDGIHMYKVGKKAAGNLLDGKTYQQWPES